MFLEFREPQAGQGEPIEPRLTHMDPDLHTKEQSVLVMVVVGHAIAGDMFQER